jgi:UDPglucose 6-dehydrogenase
LVVGFRSFLYGCIRIITEWNEFRALDLGRVKTLLKSPIFVDLRNIYRPDDMVAAGFDYTSIGRTSPAPAKQADGATA